MKRFVPIITLVLILACSVTIASRILIIGEGINNGSQIIASDIIRLANNERELRSAEALRESPILASAAQMKADDMAQNGYFSHNSPDGKRPWTWLAIAGYRYDYAGENLAMNYTESADVHNAWMMSRAHKSNILNPNYTEIGVGTAVGLVGGKEVEYTVEFFGRSVR